MPVEVKWYGAPGHICVSHYCRFHLCTQVGGCLISTVGEYFPPDGTREIIAASRGIQLDGKGDFREADYMNKIGFEEIGFGRLYETMVFKAGDPCARSGCNCGMPSISGSELDMRGYNNAKDATEGHMAFVAQYTAEQEAESGK